MLILFSFTVNTDTQEAVFVGNVEVQVALQILQQLVIADAIQKSQEPVKTKKGGKK